MWSMKSPYAVGSFTQSSSSTSFSFLRRYSMSEAMEQSLRPNFSLNAARSSRRAIVPSSFVISQMTAAGLSPARRARSTDASVWPVRWSTPPGRAAMGNTCPGMPKSSRFAAGSSRALMVAARSDALMPVVPVSTSTLSVNAVLKWSVDGAR